MAVAIVLGIRTARRAPTPDTPDGSAALRPLLAAMAKDKTRPLDARWSGGFPYAPPPLDNRAAPRITPDVGIAAATLESRVQHQDTPSAQMLLATVSFAMRDVDRAAPLLEAVTSADPGNASALNNLAAAYLSRGRRQRNPEDLARALDAVERAYRIDPSSAEVRFNRALALEAVHLSAAAAAAWNEYLEVDRGSPWHQEARGRLTALTSAGRAGDSSVSAEAIARAITTDDRAALATYARRAPSLMRLSLRQTLDAWTGTCDTRRRCDDLAPLRQAAVAAGVLVEVTSDRLEPDWLAALVSASHATRRQIALAYRRLLEGRARYDAFEYEESDVRFAEVVRLLGARASIAAEALLERAAVRYQARDFAAARPMLEAVIARANRQGYGRLIGRAEVIGGNMDVNTGEFSSALGRYERSVNAFLAAGDPDGVVNAQVSAAATLTVLGQTRESWQRYDEALSALSRLRTPRVRRALLDSVGLTAAAAGLHDTARHFGEACAAAAEQDGVPGAAAEAHLRLAGIFWRLGDQPRAQRALARARAWNEKTGNVNAAYNEARLSALEGESLRANAPASAVTQLDRAIEYYEKAQRRSNLPEALLARGRAHREAGHVDRAAADFERGLREIDALTAGVSQTRLRTSYVDTLFDLVDALVQLEVDDRRRADVAFGVSEEWRGRTLWLKRDRDQRDRRGQRGQGQRDTTTLRPDDISRSLPPDAAVIYYYVLADRLLTWVMTPRGATFRTIGVGADALAVQVRRFNESIPAGTDGGDAAVQLYDWLLRPHDVELREAKTVFVAPDSRLSGIAFPALKDATTNAYAIEARAFAIVPSLRLFGGPRLSGHRDVSRPVHDTADPRETAATVKALVMGVTGATDVTGQPVPALPSVNREVRQIASIYSASTVVTDEAATRSAFVSALATHDVVHFAGHAIANHQEPAFSRLLVAGENGGPGAIFPDDIVCPASCRARLVVLASCESAGGRTSRSEGAVSLARSFLAAGVDTTVATLWPIADQSAGELFVQLHREIAARHSVEQALRTVQIRALRSGRVPVRDWAGLEVIAGRRVGR
jgi:CHAT domain-containing protein/tetratricopeptide (TPR) repeat protein